MNLPDASIIIVNYNTKDLLHKCIGSLYKKSSRFPLEVILIDNNSSDGSVECISKDFPQVVIIANDINKGFSSANNQGISCAKGKYFILLNPDTYILPGSIDALLEFMEKNSSVGVAGPRLVTQNLIPMKSHFAFPSLKRDFMENVFLDFFHAPFSLLSYLLGKLKQKKPIAVDWITGACLALRRELIDDIGLFDERFFLYYEEVDLCYRAHKKGWKIFFIPYCDIIHYGGQSTKKKLAFSLTESFKSKYYFFKKNYSADKASLMRRSTILGIHLRLLIWRLAYFCGIRRTKAAQYVEAYRHILSIPKETYVAFDISSIHRSNAGVGCYTKNVAKKLIEISINNSVLIFLLDCPLPWKQERVRPLALRLLYVIFRVIWEQICVPVYLWIQGIDIFHSPAYVCHLFKTSKITITIHDMAYFLFPEKFVCFYRWYLRLLVPLCARMADVIITDSFCSKKDIVRLLNIKENNVEVVYLGKDDSFQPSIDSASLNNFRERYNLKRDFILYVGTIEPRKNIPTLITAYNKFRQKPHNKDYALVIGGAKGWMYSEIFSLVKKLSLDNHVTFLGYVPDYELPVLYRSARVFAYPSLYEGFGLPVIEAMSSGIPTVTSNTSSLPEIAINAAIMVDPLNSDELADAIYSAAYDEQLRQKLIKNGLARADEFSWHKTAEATMKIYQKIADRRHPALYENWH